QGSDAHRLETDKKNAKRLGIGERATELLLETPTFEAIKALFRSNQFDRTRPARAKDKPFDALAVALEEGATIVQSFHETANQRGGKLTAILSDLCAFANTAGGTVFVGANPRKDKPKGLPNVKEVEEEIRTALDERLTPPLPVKFDTLQSNNVNVLRLRVAKGDNRPYCLDDNKFYVRDETDTSLAVRDEIVALIQEVLEEADTDKSSRGGGNNSRSNNRRGGRGSNRSPMKSGTDGSQAPSSNAGSSATSDPEDAFYLPQVGVEIVESEERNGRKYHSIRDLRNGHIITNVTRKGARKLWNYAIQQHEDKPVRVDKVNWKGDVGVVRSENRAGKQRFDLALREGEQIRVFYGVTDEGMEGAWEVFIPEE
ncbi:MAG: ATP-binding protein, partial [Caldilineaceae bacterium]|nr:ATP-binding protein [Caldilineaceae bacterium]